MNTGISGYLPLRNGNSLDYHWRECVASLLPVCDEVVICDSDSDDGTTESIEQLARQEPKVRRINWPFTHPVGDYFFHDRWVNFARGHLGFNMALYMDADHVIGPESYPSIRESAAKKECRYFHYVYFWGDPQHTVPWGNEISVQLSPTEFWWPSQNTIPPDEVNIRALATMPDPAMVIYSYSMLRKREALFAKCRAWGQYIEGIADDEAINKAESTGRPLEEFYPGKEIREFKGTHPPAIHQWLLDRGWKL